MVRKMLKRDGRTGILGMDEKIAALMTEKSKVVRYARYKERLIMLSLKKLLKDHDLYDRYTSQSDIPLDKIVLEMKRRRLI